MNNSIKLFRIFLSILLIIFITQIQYSHLSSITIAIITSIQESFLGSILKVVCFFISYISILLLLLGFITYSIVFKPNYIRNSLILVFLSWTIALFSFLKLFTTELRPYMYSYLVSVGNVKTWDCETDFGMPSGHMIFVIALYYIYKVEFFCMEENLRLTPSE